MSESKMHVTELHDAVRLLKRLKGAKSPVASARARVLKRYVDVMTHYGTDKPDDLSFAIDDSDPKEPTYHIGVTWETVSDFWRAIRLNINKDGVFLRSTELPGMGSKVILTVNVAAIDLEFVVRSKVIWVNPHQRSGRPMGMGVKFAWPLEGYRDIVRSFMEGETDGDALKALV